MRSLLPCSGITLDNRHQIMDNAVPGRKEGGREQREEGRVGKREWGEGVRRHTIHVAFSILTQIHCYQFTTHTQLLKLSALKVTSLTCMHDPEAPVTSLPPLTHVLQSQRRKSTSCKSTYCEDNITRDNYKV